MSTVVDPEIIQISTDDASAIRTGGRSRPHVSHTTEFDRFFDANYDALVRSLTASTGDAGAAHDCVQEAFIKAYGRWPRLRRYDKPEAWVRKVALNKARDRHRSERRRRRREQRFSDGDLTADQPAGDAIDAASGALELLEGLTPRQRTVAALFYVEDIPIADIADSTGLSQGAVKFHLNKARESMRRKLDEEDDR